MRLYSVALSACLGLAAASQHAASQHSAAGCMDLEREYAAAVAKFDEYRGNNEVIDADEWAAFIGVVNSQWMADTAFADIAGKNGAIDVEEFAALALFVVAGAKETGSLDRDAFLAAFGSEKADLFDLMDSHESSALSWDEWRMYFVPLLILGGVAGFGVDGITTSEQWARALTRVQAFHGSDVNKDAFAYALVADHKGAVDVQRLVVVMAFISIGGADGQLSAEEWRAGQLPEEDFGHVSKDGITVTIKEFFRYHDFSVVSGGNEVITAQEWAEHNVPGDFASIAKKGAVDLATWMSL